MHHNDPFDRLLVAQAQLEEMTLVARDDQIDKYDASVLDAST
jgi:PIN domain nuclease of toxin-antitoxin system